MPDVAGPDQALSRLTKLLEGAGQLSSVLEVVDRVFQRAPHLAKEIRDTVEEEGGNKTVKKRRLIELTVDKVITINGSSCFIFCLPSLDKRSVWRFGRISRSGDGQ